MTSCRPIHVRATTALLASVLLFGPLGCNIPGSIGNGWLDPTVVGSFAESKMLEIRSSLTIDDIPPGVPGAMFPGSEDLELIYEEYPISAGDTLAIEVYELRDRQVPFQVQMQVSSMGYVNLPVVGRVNAYGLTTPEFEAALADALIEKDILLDPEVTVQPLYLQKATYSIFGIGVSASNNAPLRAGTFPIRTPELRILEAINQVGGLNEFVTEIYVFRHYVRRAEGAVGESSDASTDSSWQAQPEVEEAAGSDPPADAEVVTNEDVLEDLLAVVEQQAEPTEQGEPAESRTPTDDAIADTLRPDPSAPYVFVNGEFVRNPDYVPPDRDDAAREPAPPPSRLDAPSPAVNWARLAGDSDYRVLQIPADLLRTGDTQANIYVRPGDVIRIVSGEIGVYYVMGQVNRVGAFRFNTEEVTLKGAIAAAGGLSALAWPDRCTVYRRVGRREQMIQVDLDRIFAGNDSDFMIRRGDIINVGTHPFAPFLARIRALTLPNPINNVGYSFTYARNFADIDSFAAQRNPANDEGQRFPLIFP